MIRLSRLVTLAVSVMALSALSGCDYFGTHEGYEEGELPYLGAANMAAYEVVAVDPPAARVGDQVTLYTISDASAPTDAFTVDNWWFCTYDGQDAMLETGGDGYESSAESDVDLNGVDLGLTDEELAEVAVSSVTFTVPSGTESGEGFTITPNERFEYFDLEILQ